MKLQSQFKLLALSTALSFVLMGSVQQLSASADLKEVTGDAASSTTAPVAPVVTPVAQDDQGSTSNVTPTPANVTPAPSDVTPIPTPTPAPIPTVYAEWDANHNGKLDFYEIPAAVRSKVVKALDFDGDGKLTFNDIKTIFTKVFDRNHDGTVNFSDVILMKDDLFKVGTKLTELMTSIQTSGLLDAIPTAQRTEIQALFTKITGGITVAENGWGKLENFADDVKTELKEVRTSLQNGKLDPNTVATFKNDFTLFMNLIKEVKDTGDLRKVTTDILGLLSKK
ncbi:MAG: hypothetical protein ACTHJ4_07870 [Candidatus Nucleicultricaceae bacterium]|jgi:Ca2+-binding EF-hand superfamily protein